MTERWLINKFPKRSHFPERTEFNYGLARPQGTRSTSLRQRDYDKEEEEERCHPGNVYAVASRVN